MDLHEWLSLYVKHKDAFTKKLVKQEVDGESIIFTFKDRVLTGQSLEKLKILPWKGPTLIATLNTKENVQFLIDHWKEFSREAELTIVFVNLKLNEKWLIKPQTHHTIADTNLAQGIWSIAENTPYV